MNRKSIDVTMATIDLGGDEQEVTLVPVPYEVREQHPNLYFLQLKDESMNMRIPNGAFVAIDPDLDIAPGLIAAFHDDSEIVLGKVILLDEVDDVMFCTIEAESYTDDSGVLAFALEDVTVCGVAVWYQAPLPTV